MATPYDHSSAYHHIHVDDDGGSRVLRFEHNHQSSMRLDDPFATDILYIAYLHLTLAVAPLATRTLVIGLGGGSVVKQMWRDYPGMRLDVVEIDPEIVEVARRYFALPDDERIRVIVGDGREFVRMASGTYDIVIVDAFDDDHVPRPLLSEDFMRDVRDRLAPGGVVAWNVLGYLSGPRSRPFRSLHRTAENVFRNVWTFPVGTWDDLVEVEHNIVVLGSDAEVSDDELIERIIDGAGGVVRSAGFDLLADEMYRGRVRGGDVPLIVESPRRERGRRRR